MLWVLTRTLGYSMDLLEEKTEKLGLKLHEMVDTRQKGGWGVLYPGRADL
jgi:hypothetical protein